MLLPVALTIAGVALLVVWLVTARLFEQARRSGGAPEKTLAIAFSGLFVAGYPLAGASRTPALIETYEGSLLFTIGILGIVGGLAALNYYPRLVFRPGRPWAIGLQVLGTAGGGVAGVGSIVAVASADTPAAMIGSSQPWALALLASIGLPFLWNALESTLYYRSMKRRVALGLADPVKAHRFALWAIASWISTFEIAILLAVRANGHPVVAVLPMTFIAIAALVASLCWWLAFCMPAAYQARLVGDQPSEPSRPSCDSC